ncbi:zinc finger protein 830-like [Babylonia areolata]|uniref:zinc finger protein 830-like n=1 Tax=Babylonia areolata TaxID=304850 RepID=UPI003FD487C1
MASTKPKKQKIVSQEQLRRLMREKQFTSKTAAKKIEHPLAKYNSLDQLVCTLCNTVIKTDNLWAAHIQGSKHKEKLLASKTQGPAKPAEVTAKRKLSDAEILAAKKAKVLTSDSNGLKTSASSTSTTNRVAALAGYSSSSSSEDDEEDDKDVKKTAQRTPSTSSSSKGPGGLPEDFFDAPSKAEVEKGVNAASSKPTTMAEVLPEGFFDDPKMDAKVRQVEYKDKMEEEWELFQKSMKEESHVSEAIMEEEDEQINVERNLDEIDDQIQRWKEVEDLHVKKETIPKTSSDDKDRDNDSDDLDEEDLDQFLDWRSKKSWK